MNRLPALPPRARAILIEEATAAGLQPIDLIQRSQFPHIVNARHRAMARMVAELGYSRQMVGRIMQRDHTTVTYAYRKLAGTLPRRSSAALEASHRAGQSASLYPVPAGWKGAR